eukprot:CAMPEP_0194245744 /NCGR_PEP_ID=MMETSP0158-20130606/13902_1 /TAXON_ID=33649 /ORGANISM="Thalassionema nitzschioides, Strain L26-B" /LENGTH=72 /DNA_ID=CAMNT_0038981509 /DNA_START=60 /DNA_END=275 /DNA_ORIENTATION=-
MEFIVIMASIMEFIIITPFTIDHADQHHHADHHHLATHGITIAITTAELVLATATTMVSITASTMEFTIVMD